MDGDIKSPREASGSFTAKLTPEGAAMVKQMFARYPSSCPHCGWEHPSEMFKRVDEGWVCMKCGEAVHLLPTEQEEWPDTIP
jgi:hypothetical protein